MDHIRLIEEEFSFAAKRPEIHFAIPLESKLNLKEVTLSMATRPGFAFSQAGCDGIRIYADQHDLTNYYAAELRDVIDGWDQAATKSAYKAAMDRWLDFAEKLGAAYGAPDFAQERARAQELLNIQPLSSLIQKLGDTGHGWSGHLHLLNFIHRFGMSYAVSLTEAAHRFSQDTGTPLSILDVSELTISSGRSPTLDPGFEVGVDDARGAVSLHFELRYHNTLVDEIEELRRQFEALRDRIDQRLDSIVYALSPGGQIQRRLSAIEREVTEASDAATQAQQDVVDHEKHLSSLERKVLELKNLIQSL